MANPVWEGAGYVAYPPSKRAGSAAAIEKVSVSALLGILLVSRLVLGAALRAPRVSSVTPRNSSSLSAQLSSATQMASEAVHYDLLVRPA